MPTIAYRLADPSDCRALAELKGKVWNTTYAGIYPQERLRGYDVAHNERIFASIIANPAIELHIATDEGHIVGFMTCGSLFKPRPGFQREIGLLYILQSHQRRGIGRGFFAIARERFRRDGVPRFIVAVNRLNQPALAFYRAMGGVPALEEGEQIIFVFLTDP